MEDPSGWNGYDQWAGGIRSGGHTRVPVSSSSSVCPQAWSRMTCHIRILGKERRGQWVVWFYDPLARKREMRLDLGSLFTYC